MAARWARTKSSEPGASTHARASPYVPRRRVARRMLRREGESIVIRVVFEFGVWEATAVCGINRILRISIGS